MVRSETKVTPEVVKAAKNLRVIARAGIGVDNINLEAATGAGIAVVNAPLGNTVAAAEHTMALMLALARNVPQAYQSLKQGEWKRSSFMGIEVRNKVLGVIGLGRVGSEVCRRAQSFGMRLVGFDPFVAPDYARRLGVETMSLDKLLEEADFVTLHTPLTPSTSNLIGRRELGLLKPGARLNQRGSGGTDRRRGTTGGSGLGPPGRCGPGRICLGAPGGRLAPGDAPQGPGHAPPGSLDRRSSAGGCDRGRRTGTGRPERASRA